MTKNSRGEVRFQPLGTSLVAKEICCIDIWQGQAKVDDRVRISPTKEVIDGSYCDWLPWTVLLNPKFREPEGLQGDGQQLPSIPASPRHQQPGHWERLQGQMRAKGINASAFEPAKFGQNVQCFEVTLERNTTASWSPPIRCYHGCWYGSS